jgi:L-rhamnose 1-dehydrogenase
MSNLLARKIVCITGASRGIGRACARESARHGAGGLLLHYYGDSATEAEIVSLKEEIKSISPEAKVVSVPGDIGDPTTAKNVCVLHCVRVQGLLIHTLDRS